MTIGQLVKQARGGAYWDAKASFPWVRSRGTVLATASDNGQQVEPYPEAAGLTWDGSIGSLRKAVSLVREQFPEVASVYLAGGFDGGGTYEELHGDNYEPCASSWHVVVWTRESGWATHELPNF